MGTSAFLLESYIRIFFFVKSRQKMPKIQKQKNRPADARAVFFNRLSREKLLRGFFLFVFQRRETQASVFVAEFCQTAFFQHFRRAAGPGGVVERIDVEAHDIAGFAPAAARRVFGAVSHDDFDFVVIGMDIGLHGGSSLKSLSGWLFTEIFLIVQAVC
jgi:hypothetical protein